jgi:hypothetical protein
MRSRQMLGWIVAVGLLCVLPTQGQEGRPISERPGSSARALARESESLTPPGVLSPETQAAAPRLVKFSGALAEPRTPSSGPVEMTLALYKDELGGEPLWTEIQNVEIDKTGRYTVLLGATKAEGLPVELFPSGEPRWLAVEIQGQPQQPRSLLVGVPYALKAVEAEKLGGKSASDFVLSESLGEQVRRVIEGQTGFTSQATSTGTLQQGQTTKANSALSPQMTSAGPMFPPSKFSGTTGDQIVLVQQNGSGNALYGQTASSAGASGVVGIASSTSTSNYQNGVYGQNAGAGAGVAGIATSPSAGVGVYGQTASTGGNGVAGNATATSGYANGVFGQSASTSGTGVTGYAPTTGIFGNATATSGFTSGVSGDATSSPNGAGVFGRTVQWIGVGGQATATSGTPAYGVWGDTASTSGAGVVGFANSPSGYSYGVAGNNTSVNGIGVFGNATATSGSPSGVYGTTISPNGNGVVGVNSSNSGNYDSGVLGINNGTTGNAYGVNGSTQTTGFGAGVAGQASATTGNAFGVFGQTNSPNGPAVFGHAASTSGYPTAVEGWLDSNDGGVAGTFVAHTGVGLILQGVSGPNFNQVFSVGANGDLNISGNLTVSGTKSSTAKLQNGREVLLYAVESPENWFEDFGSGELKNGSAWMPLDTSFAEATNTAITYHVFLTPNGDSNGLYVARKTAAGFEVREQGGGGSNVAFDYRIVVKRRGYEAMRMAEVHGDVTTLEASRQHLAQLANSGNLKKVAVVKAPQIVPPLAIRPVPSRPSIPQQPKLNIPQPPRPRQ